MLTETPSFEILGVAVYATKTMMTYVILVEKVLAEVNSFHIVKCPFCSILANVGISLLPAQPAPQIPAASNETITNAIPPSSLSSSTLPISTKSSVSNLSSSSSSTTPAAATAVVTLSTPQAPPLSLSSTPVISIGATGLKSTLAPTLLHASSSTQMPLLAKPRLRGGSSGEELATQRITTPQNAVSSASTSTTNSSVGTRRRHQCPYCTKSCERKDNLQAHIRTHTGRLLFNSLFNIVRLFTFIKNY